MRKILSIDGGGIKGVFPAAFLAALEEEYGSPAEYFDLIVGTSTGGVIALGLGMGLSAKDILGFYEMHGPDIFKGNRFLRYLRWFGLNKFNNVALRNALEKVFNEQRLGKSRNRLVIPSMNLETGEVYVYKTAHTPRFQRDYKEKAVDVALATSAAPTYFPSYRSATGIPLVDGGTWANNPAGLSVVEAIGVLGWPRESLKVLSLGCTVEPFNVSWARRYGLGKIYWASKVADVFMSGQSFASIGTAQLLAGHENVVRINPAVPAKRFSLDACKEISALKGLGYSEARKALPQVEFFFKEKAEVFEPYHHLEQ